MLGREEKSNTIKTNNTTQENKSEGTGEERRLKRYRDRIKYRQNKTFQNNEKITLQVGRKCTKTYQPDAKEAKLFWSKIWERNLAWTDYKKAYMVRIIQSCARLYHKMYKISDEGIKFIGETMKNYRVEMTAERKCLAEVKIQRGIFQGDALSPLLFIIAMMPLNHILRKCTAGYKLTK